MKSFAILVVATKFENFHLLLLFCMLSFLKLSTQKLFLKKDICGFSQYLESIKTDF